MAKNKVSGDKKNVWKGIQKRLSTNIKKPQENEPKESKSKSSSMTSVEEFKDAENEEFKDPENEDDDYFQSETTEDSQDIVPEKKKSERPMSEMAFILPALQNHGYDSDEDDVESLKDLNLVQESPKESLKELPKELLKELPKESSKELPKESPKELLKESPVIVDEKEIKVKKLEKPATFEPIPAEKPQIKEIVAESIKESVEPTKDTQDSVGSVKDVVEPAKDTQDSVKPINETQAIVEDIVELAKDIPIEALEEPVKEAQVEPVKEAQAEPIKETQVEQVKEAHDEQVKEAQIEPSKETQVELVKEAQVEQVKEAQVKEPVVETQDSVEKKPCEPIDDVSLSVESTSAVLDPIDDNKENIPKTNRLASILPGVEESLKNVTSTLDLKKSLEEQTQPPDRSKRSREFEYSIEDPIDLDLFRDNVISIESIDPKDIPVNNLKPRQQEEADQPIREGMKHLFDNRFMKAKKIFETRSTVDPLYALGLGAMAFIKAIMTFHEFDRETAMNALATAYTIAKAQIDNASFKKPFKDTVSQYFNSILSTSKNGLPADPPTSSMPNSGGGLSDPSTYMPNGILRAHVVKAECCLLMGILQMTQESMVGYLKCGLNIRRAYHSYGIVWREYKRMGQEFTKYMDCDTVSAIQFGIGSVHLILSSMPPKILKIFSLMGWKSDKQLGFALLKLCLEGRGIRAPLASLMLLAYYSVLTSFAPQLYTKEIMNPAIECLLDAQGNHPNSCFFLFFAARISRVAKNLPLSIQSFQFASESSKGEWTEVAMKQLSDYEIGFNHALQLDWSSAIDYFQQLVQDKYWSPAFSQYLVGACYEMMGQRTEAILAFAQVSVIKDQSKKSYIDSYVEKKVEFFQRSGYQDLDFSLPAIEIFLVLNAFEYLEKDPLEKCLGQVDRTLEMIYEREKIEYTVRLRELVPASAPPDYYDQRCILLLAKASILNSLGRYDETIPHLNWVLDHRDCISHETWIVPFTYWESGITSWGLNNYIKSRKLWQLAMGCTKYDFEYRMAVRLSLALSKCDDMGVTHIDEKELKGESTNSRKRMPILSISPQVV